MSLSVGIVGLANVGKSTLFNAMLKKQLALAANYPFATIEPNVGIVPVPDDRLVRLAEVIRSQKPEISVTLGSREGMPVAINPDVGNESLSHKPLPPMVPATVTFVDIAGLVAGAHKGEGLGNQFLAHIREVDLMCLVIRAFADPEVVETGSGNPTEDIKTLKTELMMKDIETIESQKAKFKSQNHNPKLKSALDSILRGFDEGKMASEVVSIEEAEEIKDLHLLTMKPYLVIVNAGERKLQATSDKLQDEYTQLLGKDQDELVVICAKIESELAALSEHEQEEYLAGYGLEQSGLERLIKRSYDKLGLISFLTAGEKEVRAWTIRQGDTALEASAVIHTDFAKHFIRAEVIEFGKFIKAGGWKRARELGWVRSEGRDYLMQEGEVVEFKIGK